RKPCLLHIPGGGVLTVLEEDDVKIRPWENLACQKWKIEWLGDFYAFRNLVSQRLLRVKWNGSVCADGKELENSKLFSLERSSSTTSLYAETPMENSDDPG
ncbi:hypothetical protein BBP40_009419, partial [Aspergillus hancockii]